MRSKVIVICENNMCAMHPCKFPVLYTRSRCKVQYSAIYVTIAMHFVNEVFYCNHKFNVNFSFLNWNRFPVGFSLPALHSDVCMQHK